MKKSEIDILVIDDDPSTRSVLSEAIKRSGYKVETCKNPEEALNLVKIKPYNLAIIDCMLPMKSGIDLAQEFRGTAFATNPIILISGVFKDSSFIQEVKEKQEIVEYLVKPININQLTHLINQTLEPLLDEPKIVLNSLLSMKNSNARTWRKSIESLEEVRGFDLGLVSCILLDPKIKGHLNLSSPDGTVSGVSFSEGKIVQVDTPNTKDQIKMLLTQYGLLYTSDLEDLKVDEIKGDLLKALVEKNYISPHMVPVIRTQQILSELRGLMSNQMYRINFSPDRKIKNIYNLNIDINSITPSLHEVLFRSTEHEWLKVFFSDWYDHPMDIGEEFSESHLLFEMPLVCKIRKIKDYIKENSTIREVVKNEKLKEWEVLNAIYLLSIRKVIKFSEQKKITDLSTYKKRMKNLFMNIDGIALHEIFFYFGCSKSLRPFEVAKVYKEFSKIYHPDKLPQGLEDKELREVNQRLFSLVSESYSVLTNEKKRKDYFDGLKQKAAEDEMRVDDLLEKLKKFVLKRDFSAAKSCIDEARTLSESDNVEVFSLYYDIKSLPAAKLAETASEKLEKLKALNNDLSKDDYYYLVLGILYKITGDREMAEKSLKRSLSFNSNLLEAKRELSTLEKKKLSLKELLTGDISTSLKQIFKK